MRVVGIKRDHGIGGSLLLPNRRGEAYNKSSFNGMWTEARQRAGITAAALYRGMIVGVEVEIANIGGKQKLGQNGDTRDSKGAIRTLDERGESALSQAMRRVLGRND